MKGARSQNNKQNKQMVGHRPTPDIRDNLDSREGEEWIEKGDDVTHTHKDKKNKQPRKKNR